MSDDGSVASLLDDRPDLEDPLASVLAVDDERDTWTFEDVPIDSGPFGELVSRNVVESVGDEYRLADPGAVRQALEGGPAPEIDSKGTAGPTIDVQGLSLPSIDRTTAGFVAASIAIVGLVRLHTIGAVYRNGDVVLSGNDPYAYRYYVEQIAGVSAGPFDFGALAAIPHAMQNGEPLMVATLWWVSELLGGGVGAIGTVLAWYPVVSALVTAGAVYLLAVKLTADRRVGLAAVLLFAIIPGHAMRTSLGFADHHAFDYPWLAATALLLVVLAGTSRTDLYDPKTWLASAGLGIAVAAQVLAWDAGPLLLAPIGLAVIVATAATVLHDRSPVVEVAPVVVGLAVGTVLAAGVHTLAGWQTDAVAYAPGLVLVGVLVVAGIAEAVRRTTGDVRHILALDVVAALVGVVGVVVLLPSFWDLFVTRLDALFRGDAIAETTSLFDLSSFGFFLLMGFTLVLAIPMMAWAVARAREDVRWGILAAYAWYFLALAGLQIRFVGELATFAAVFAGVGFVWMAAWIDAIPAIDFGRRILEPIRLPDRGTVVTLVLLFALVGSIGLVQVPVKTSQVTLSDDMYETATFIEERSAELGQEYPENYVLSEWGDSRKYNYFVNGQSRGYGFALNNYEDFATGTDPDSWYDRFEGRVGYVVMEPAPEGASSEVTTWKLTRAFGSATDSTDGVAHFQAIYRAPGETRTTFAVVPGAELRGTAAANATVTVSTDVDIPNAEFTYERQVSANATGDWNLRVAYPGTYSLDGDGISGTVELSTDDVRTGGVVRADGGD